MIITELLVVFPFSTLFNYSLFESQSDDFILIIEATISKLVYFIFIHLILKFSEKEFKDSVPKSSVLLCVLPIASIILLHTSTIYSVNNGFEIAIIIGNILILLANIVVFYVYETTIRINKKYTQILLDKQKEESTANYYKLSQDQNENSRVLIHDITKHLNTIKQLSYNKDSNISQYISEIVEDFKLNNPIDYCNKPIINLITYRYYELCQKNNITFTISVKNAYLNFMQDHDITAILDNLLENAVEAAKKSNEKFIDFSISTRNPGTFSSNKYLGLLTSAIRAISKNSVPLASSNPPRFPQMLND